jgi:hypothetical protein
MADAIQGGYQYTARECFHDLQVAGRGLSWERARGEAPFDR